MKTLGEYLVQNGWITEPQLDQALAKQAQVGGRLGTCLVETGVLDETLLLKALSLQSGAPTAAAGDLADIPAETIARLPAKLAASHLAIPFRVFNNRVDVAVADLGDLTRLDELAFVLGNRVRLHIASEAGVHQALERYYEIPCPSRYRLLDGTRLPRPAKAATDQSTMTAPRVVAAATPTAPAEATEAPLPETQPRRPEKKKSIPLTADEERALWGEATQQISVAGELNELADGSGVEFGRRLAVAESPDDIGAALLAALSQHFIRILLFRILRHRVSGWMHWGPQIDKDWLAEYSVGIDRPTVFREIQASRTFFLGRLGDNRDHSALARCWGGDTKSECMVFPVLVRERLATAVYCDRGALGVTGVDISAVRDLCARAGLALERLILERKLRS